MVWQRGNRADYDFWSDIGNGPSWSFDGLLPYLERSEAYASANSCTPPLAAVDPEEPRLDSLRRQMDGFHGHDGPVQISYNTYQTALDRPASLALLNALSNSTGHTFPPNHNPDGGDDVSVPLFGTSRSVSPVTGLRSYAASAYLDQPGDVWDRPQLSVVTSAVVSRIVFEGFTAQAVGFISEVDGESYMARLATGGEVILSAGMLFLHYILLASDR
jgi:choline dehydrogenase